MFEEEQKNYLEQDNIPAPIENEDILQSEKIKDFFPQIVITPEQEERTNIKKISNQIGIAFLIMTAAMFSFSYFAIKTMAILGFDYNQTFNFLNEPAVSQVQQIIFSLIIFTIPFILVCKICRYRISDLISFEKPKKEFIIPLFFIGMSFCAFSNIAASFAGNIFKNFGIDYEVTKVQDPDGFFGLILSVLATVVVPSLVEEFACRGIVLGLLRKFGDLFAIMVSAALFGLMHSNFEQIPFAFFVGIGLGFITVKSGSIWLAVLVHACNNAIPIIYSYFLSNFSLNLQNITYTIFLIVQLIVGIVSLLFIKDSKFFEFNKSKTKNKFGSKIKVFFSGAPIIIFVACCILSSLKFFI